MRMEVTLTLSLPKAGDSLGVRMSNLNEVLDLDPNGLAKAAGLQKNDRVFSVDGRKLVADDGSIASVAPLLKRGPKEVGLIERKLVVLRASTAAVPSALGDLITLNISRDERGSLGFNVTPDNVVSALKPGGVAEQAGMHVGDEVVSVDDSLLPPGARLGAVMLRSRSTYKVGLLRKKEGGGVRTDPSHDAPAPPTRAPAASLPEQPPRAGSEVSATCTAVVRKLPGHDLRPKNFSSVVNSELSPNLSQPGGYMSLLSDTARMLLQAGSATVETDEERLPAPPPKAPQAMAHSLLPSSTEGNGHIKEERQSEEEGAARRAASRLRGPGAPPSGGRFSSSIDDVGGGGSVRGGGGLGGVGGGSLLPSSMRYALIRPDGRGGAKPQLATAALPPDGGGLRPREVLLRTVAATVSSRDAHAWRQAKAVVAGDADVDAVGLRRQGAGARYAAMAAGGVWARSLRFCDLEERDEGLVGTVSAVCGEVLSVGTAVREVKPGDLAVLSCPAGRANTAFLGQHAGWHRSPHGVYGCPLASVLCVPQDASSLEPGYAFAKVPKGMHPEDAVLAAEAMIGAIAAAAHAVSPPSPPPPPLWHLSDSSPLSRSPAGGGSGGGVLGATADGAVAGGLHSALLEAGESAARLGAGRGLYAVFGCGASGLMSLCALRQTKGPDAVLIAVDARPERQRLALRLGATEACTPEEAMEVVKRRSSPGRVGCEGIVETSGNGMLEVSLACLADEGALACVAARYGMRPAGSSGSEGAGSVGMVPPALGELPVPLDVLAERALRVSFAHGDARELLGHALVLAAAAAQSGLPLREAVTHRVSLDEVDAAYALAADTEASVRVLVYPGQTEVRQVGSALAMYSQLD